MRRQEREQWVSLILSLETALRLYKHRPGTLVEHWEYLLQRTDGVIGSLSELLRKAAIMAITDGSETISLTLLDSIKIDFTAFMSEQELSKKIGKPRRSRKATA